MNRKEFEKLLARDHYCQQCGATEALAPNHRANRGMGGSKRRDHASNYVLLCSVYNGEIEASSAAAEEAKRYGWKLEQWQDARTVPVFDAMAGKWFMLDDTYGKTEVEEGTT